MALASGITRTSPAEIDRAVTEAARGGVPVFVLSTAERTDGAAFFDAVRSALPLDPPLLSARSWDALADSLWEGVRMLKSDAVLITWPDAWRFQAANPEDYAVATGILGDLAESLLDPVSTAGKAKVVSVFLGSS